MSVSREWTSQVRAVVADIRVARDSGPTVESEAWRAYDWNAHMLAAPLEQSERARQIRAINRIALTYGWQSAVAHFLDSRGVPHVSDLTDPQVEDLHARMLGYLDGAMNACDSDEALPAR